jgi:hypothetical protein
MDQHIPDLVSDWGIAPKYMAIGQIEQRQISAHFQRKKGELTHQTVVIQQLNWRINMAMGLGHILGSLFL